MAAASPDNASSIRSRGRVMVGTLIFSVVFAIIAHVAMSYSFGTATSGLYALGWPAAAVFAIPVGFITALAVNGAKLLISRRVPVRHWVVRVATSATGAAWFAVGFHVLWSAMWSSGAPWWAVVGAAVVGALAGALLVGSPVAPRRPGELTIADQARQPDEAG